MLTVAIDSLGIVPVTRWKEDKLGFEIGPVEVTLENIRTVAKMAAIARSKTGRSQLSPSRRFTSRTVRARLSGKSEIASRKTTRSRL